MFLLRDQEEQHSSILFLPVVFQSPEALTVFIHSCLLQAPQKQSNTERSVHIVDHHHPLAVQ